jgi:hypothetical protein
MYSFDDAAERSRVFYLRVVLEYVADLVKLWGC